MPVERMYLERYAKLRAKLPEISKVTHTHCTGTHTLSLGLSLEEGAKPAGAKNGERRKDQFPTN